MKKLISICGSDIGDKNLSAKALAISEDLGKNIAKKGGVVICGGHGGVMESVCKGAKSEGGITVGIMPFGKNEANKYIDIAIPTFLGNIRNYLVASAGNVMIAIGGRWGTLNEITYRIITGKPLILIKGTGGSVDEFIKNKYDNNSNIYIVKSAKDAVEKAFELI